MKNYSPPLFVPPKCRECFRFRPTEITRTPHSFSTHFVIIIIHMAPNTPTLHCWVSNDICIPRGIRQQKLTRQRNLCKTLFVHVKHHNSVNQQLYSAFECSPIFPRFLNHSNDCVLDLHSNPSRHHSIHPPSDSLHCKQQLFRSATSPANSIPSRSSSFTQLGKQMEKYVSQMQLPLHTYR